MWDSGNYLYRLEHTSFSLNLTQQKLLNGKQLESVLNKWAGIFFQEMTCYSDWRELVRVSLRIIQCASSIGHL